MQASPPPRPPVPPITRKGYRAERAASETRSVVFLLLSLLLPGWLVFSGCAGLWHHCKLLGSQGPPLANFWPRKLGLFPGQRSFLVFCPAGRGYWALREDEKSWRRKGLLGWWWKESPATWAQVWELSHVSSSSRSSLLQIPAHLPPPSHHVVRLACNPLFRAAWPQT